jgi:hypothetical protein
MRKAARDAFQAAGLTYDALNASTMRLLRALVNERMEASGCMQGSLRCKQRGVVQQTKWGRYAELKCRAYYFSEREAITFNTDGFIGFAGWADDGNVKPILDGFHAWVSELAKRPTLENAPLGTIAPAIGGGHWRRTERGWQWGTNGSTFPRPGGDWNGDLIPPTQPEKTE